MPVRKLILDLDTGIDDALAIAYALGSEDAELIGITGTYGNVTVEQGMRNSHAVADVLGHPQVRVYPGIDHPTWSGEFVVTPDSTRIHGRNGLGDVTIPDSPRPPETTPAADFILNAANTYGKDLTIVATGAMSTLAEVIRREPKLDEKVGSITLMAGALTIPGNVTPGCDSNLIFEISDDQVGFPVEGIVSLAFLMYCNINVFSRTHASTQRQQPITPNY